MGNAFSTRKSRNSRSSNKSYDYDIDDEHHPNIHDNRDVWRPTLRTFHNSFLEKADESIDAVLSQTPFRPRYLGFRFESDDCPNSKSIYAQEKTYLRDCLMQKVIYPDRLRSIYNVLHQLAYYEDQNSPRRKANVRHLIGTSFTAMEGAAVVLYYAANGISFSRLYNQGYVFGALLSLHQCVQLAKTLFYTSQNDINHTKQLLIALRCYIEAFGTALLRVLQLKKNEIHAEMLKKSKVVASTHDEKKEQHARLCVATLYALLQCIRSNNGLYDDHLNSIRYSKMLTILSNYQTITEEVVAPLQELQEPTTSISRELTIDNIIETLNRDCQPPPPPPTSPGMDRNVVDVHTYDNNINEDLLRL